MSEPETVIDYTRGCESPRVTADGPDVLNSGKSGYLTPRSAKPNKPAQVELTEVDQLRLQVAALGEEIAALKLSMRDLLQLWHDAQRSGATIGVAR